MLPRLELNSTITSRTGGRPLIRMYSRYFLEGGGECIRTLFTPLPNGKVLKRTGDFRSISALTDHTGAPLPLDINEISLFLLVEKTLRDIRGANS
ncbi:MAG: hypothetical protein N3H30_01275 [Candidatus Micrarchaeota archaeon]|nr:hypothetical protein [Candidatus Micrarchaeota archaeon]